MYYLSSRSTLTMAAARLTNGDSNTSSQHALKCSSTGQPERRLFCDAFNLKLEPGMHRCSPLLRCSVLLWCAARCEPMKARLVEPTLSPTATPPLFTPTLQQQQQHTCWPTVFVCQSDSGKHAKHIQVGRLHQKLRRQVAMSSQQCSRSMLHKCNTSSTF
jgi:hypothetical protein